MTNQSQSKHYTTELMYWYFYSCSDFRITFPVKGFQSTLATDFMFVTWLERFTTRQFLKDM